MRNKQVKFYHTPFIGADLDKYIKKRALIGLDKPLSHCYKNATHALLKTAEMLL